MSRVSGTPTSVTKRSSISFIAERFTPTRRVDSWRRRRAEEKQCRKNRKIINNYIRQMGKDGGGQLSLDSNGACCFPYKKLVFCIEVPHSSSDTCLFSSNVCLLSAQCNRKEVMRVALTMNKKSGERNFGPGGGLAPIFQREDGRMTRVSVPLLLSPLDRIITLTIPTVGDAATLSMKVPIKRLTYEQMIGCLERFIKSALEVNSSLELVA